MVMGRFGRESGRCRFGDNSIPGLDIRTTRSNSTVRGTENCFQRYKGCSASLGKSARGTVVEQYQRRCRVRLRAPSQCKGKGIMTRPIRQYLTIFTCNSKESHQTWHEPIRKNGSWQIMGEDRSPTMSILKFESANSSAVVNDAWSMREKKSFPRYQKESFLIFHFDATGSVWLIGVLR